MRRNAYAYNLRLGNYAYRVTRINRSTRNLQVLRLKLDTCTKGGLLWKLKRQKYRILKIFFSKIRNKKTKLCRTFRFLRNLRRESKFSKHSPKIVLGNESKGSDL